MPHLYITLVGYSRLSPIERRQLFASAPEAVSLVKAEIGIWFVRSLRDPVADAIRRVMAEHEPALRYLASR